MYTKIAQFSLSSKKLNKINEIFITQPDFSIEKIAGKLFTILEIDNSYKNTPKIINFLNNTINNNYYQNEKIIFREKINTLKIEHIFEASLAKTNKQFSDFLEKEKINFNFNTINITIGVIFENNIHFANTGKNKIILVYKNLKKEKESPILDNDKKENYKISDISKHIITNEENEESHEKLFSNVVSGKIPPKGTFIICNEALPEYFSNNQLIDTVSTLPPLPAVTQIKNYLNTLNVYTSFYGIIIKNTSLDPEESRLSTRLIPNNNSINQLSQTENETENLLSPESILSKINLSFITPFFKKWQSRSTNTNLALKDKIIFQKKNFYFFKKILEYIKNFFIYTGNFIAYIAKNTFNSKNPREALKRIPVFFITLNTKSKILLALFVFFIALFFSNLFYLKTKNQKQEAQVNYRNITAEIEQKQNQIDATLIYNDDNSAKKLFAELQNLINQLPKKSPEENQKYLKFKEKIDAQMEKIRKVTKVDQPLKLIDFSKLNANAQTKNIILLPNDKQGVIYGADASQKSIYIFDLQEKSATTFTPTEPIDIIDFSSPSENGNNVIYYLNNKNILEFTPAKNSINEITIEEKALTELTTIEIYGDKLYILNKNGEISRYTKKGKTFISGYLWNQNNTSELINAIDISIEGSIFAITSTSSIAKFTRGEKTELVPEPIDPPFTNPIKIHASADFKFLYILEPTQKRLAVFSKDGKFLTQYQFTTLENIADFAIDEKNKKIYLLNNNIIFSAPITHF